MDEGRFAFLRPIFNRRLGTADFTRSFDVRLGPSFEADDWVIAGASVGLRRDRRWGARTRPDLRSSCTARMATMSCQNAAAILREIGVTARYLGKAALPLGRNRPAAAPQTRA